MTTRKGFCYTIRYSDDPRRLYYPLGALLAGITAGVPFHLPFANTGPLLVFPSVDDAVQFVWQEQARANLQRLHRIQEAPPQLLAHTVTRRDVTAELWWCHWLPWDRRLPRARQQRPCWFWGPAAAQTSHWPGLTARLRLARAITLRGMVVTWAEIPDEPLIC